MKKRSLMFLLAALMLLSLAVPAMAVSADVESAPPPVIVAYYEIDLPNGDTITVPRSEETRLYFRTWNGQLQVRVWGITSGRWLTPWTNIYG